MNFLENEVFLRAAISNVAGIRNTKVKFKGFDMGSYRRSLGAHLRKLLDDRVRISLNQNNVRMSFPREKIFSDVPMDEKTESINKLLFKPYIMGETNNTVHSLYAYNASGYLKHLCNLRNYMVENEYLSDIAYHLDRLIFSHSLYQAVYEDYDNHLLTESRIAYHDFVKEIAFDTPTERIEYATTTPSLTNSLYWIYHHREEVVLFNLAANALNTDTTCPSFPLDIPYRALLDRKFLAIISEFGSGNNAISNE